MMPYGDNPLNPADYDTVLERGLAPMWQEAQSQVHGAWDNEFKFPNVFGLTALLRTVFVAPTEMVLTSSNLYLPDGELCELSSPKLYTFHNAVLYLHHNSWRARICKGCEKYFVANHPKRDYCEYPDARGETCRQKNDNKRRLDYYYKTGKKKRQTKKRKGSPRLPGSQRKKAASRT